MAERAVFLCILAPKIEFINLILKYWRGDRIFILFLSFEFDIAFFFNY